MYIVIIVMIVLNLFSFFLYGYDKRKAIKRAYRVPEKTLLGLGIIAPFGCLIGMKVWHHKTKKWYFVVLNYICSILQLIAIYYVNIVIP